jgi:hypothetical protein
MDEPMTIVAYDPANWVGDDGERIKIPKFRDAQRAHKFCKKHGFNRLPDHVELVFLKDLVLAIDYARRVPTRLPEVFEVEIKKNPKLSWDYLKVVIRAPLPEFEESLSQNPAILVEYSREMLCSALPEHLENSLAGDPYSCFEYAWQILDGRLPEVLHNSMFCANMDSNYGRRYRGGYKRKLHDAEEYNPDYSSPQEYFEFIKWQRKNLHRQISHYQKIYGIDSTKSVGEFLYELEHGR